MIDQARPTEAQWRDLQAAAQARRAGQPVAPPDHPVYGDFAANGGVIGHLGQTLDGYIAAADGDSYFVTGPENLDHLHRLRALCDAIVVGAGTVMVDDPMLTTRRVPGVNPVRVVIDRQGRLPVDRKVFADGAAHTLYVSVSGETKGRGAGIALPLGEDGQADTQALCAILRERGLTAIFVEGGGDTVSRFMTQGALDRLHLTVAPALLGEGRRAVRLPGRAMGNALRPPVHHISMGDDVLFDLDLRTAK